VTFYIIIHVEKRHVDSSPRSMSLLLWRPGRLLLGSGVPSTGTASPPRPDPEVIPVYIIVDIRPYADLASASRSTLSPHSFLFGRPVAAACLGGVHTEIPHLRPMLPSICRDLRLVRSLILLPPPGHITPCSGSMRWLERLFSFLHLGLHCQDTERRGRWPQ
jgi:hypothetical protein